MYICQCKGLQMGRSNGALFKEVATFWRFHVLYIYKESKIDGKTTKNTPVEAMVYIPIPLIVSTSSSKSLSVLSFLFRRLGSSQCRVYSGP